MVLFSVILVAYLFLYIGGRHYLKEGYQGLSAGGNGDAAGAGSPTVKDLYPVPPPVLPDVVDARAKADQEKEGRVIMEYTTPGTVAKQGIYSVDDYEYNYVFQNENDRELSMAMRNKLMSQRPMDWAGLPPSSSQFEAGVREMFQNKDDVTKPYVDPKNDPYKYVNGENMIPPDTLGVEMEERKILQSYSPPTAQELTSYNPEDEPQNPEELIRKIYDQKGLIPTVAHDAGTNVYEVVGVRRKDEKVLYEDEEAPASSMPVRSSGEASITAPAVANDMAAAKDPYYDPTAPGGSRMDRWNYQAWTPGLERMFGPTEPRTDWH
jgi:hypothetical protein